MKPLFADYKIIHFIVGLGGLWGAYRAAMAGCWTVKNRRFHSDLKQMDHLLLALGVPNEYYTDKRVIRVGILNVGFGMALGFIALALISNIELFGLIGIAMMVPLVFVCLFFFIFDSPWKIKK